MKIFFLSFFTIFAIFWGIFFKLEIEKNDFYACEGFLNISNMYHYDLHKDIPLPLKKVVLDNYEDTGLLKVGNCIEPKNENSLGIVDIRRHSDSLNYKFNKFTFDTFSNEEDKEDIKNKMLFDEENIFSHSFFYSQGYETIIESFNRQIQDIHITNPEYYLNIRLMNNYELSPFYIFNNKNLNNYETFLNIKIFYSNFAENNISKNNNNLLNFNYQKEIGITPKKDKIFSTEGGNIKIRTTSLKINSSEEFEFLNIYLKKNFNVNLENKLKFFKNNVDFNLGFNEDLFIIDVFYKEDERIFEVSFSYAD